MRAVDYIDCDSYQLCLFSCNACLDGNIPGAACCFRLLAGGRAGLCGDAGWVNERIAVFLFLVFLFAQICQIRGGCSLLRHVQQSPGSRHVLPGLCVCAATANRIQSDRPRRPKCILASRKPRLLPQSKRLPCRGWPMNAPECRQVAMASVS